MASEDGIVVRGGATDREVAALVVVLRAVATAPEPEPAHSRRWGAPAAAVRRPLAPGPGGWRASSLP